MKAFLMWSPAAVSCAAFFGSAGRVEVKDYEFYRGDVISYMLGCGFETMAQCQAMSFAAMTACAVPFTLGLPAPARRLPGSIARDDKGNTPLELATAGVRS